MGMNKHLLTTITASLLLCTGCAELTKVATDVGVATGKISLEQAQSIHRTTDALEKSFKDITPEQEYYIGRSVAATLLSTYQPLNQTASVHYLNTLGQTLAMASDRPDTFGGYHFGLVDTDEVNAFAAPGGLILVSRGLVRCCRSEDALAAVLAHEVAHVEKQHGLKAIRTGRLTSGLTVLAAEAGKNLGGEKLAEVTKAFEGSIGDVVGTLVNSGYSRSQEFEADAAAVRIMQKVGYNPAGLVDMLREMQKRVSPGSHGFGATHPTPKDRLDALRAIIGEPKALDAFPGRQKRFTSALAGI